MYFSSQDEEIHSPTKNSNSDPQIHFGMFPNLDQRVLDLDHRFSKRLSIPRLHLQGRNKF
jgi:hypothetical protein